MPRSLPARRPAETAALSAAAAVVLARLLGWADDPDAVAALVVVVGAVPGVVTAIVARRR